MIIAMGTEIFADESQHTYLNVNFYLLICFVSQREPVTSRFNKLRLLQCFTATLQKTIFMLRVHHIYSPHQPSKHLI